MVEGDTWQDVVFHVACAVVALGIVFHRQVLIAGVVASLCGAAFMICRGNFL